MNTTRLLSLENVPSALKATVNENLHIHKWTLGELWIDDEICGGRIPVLTLAGYHFLAKKEYLWFLREDVDGGLVHTRPDGLRYIEGGLKHLDIESGEFYEPGER